MIDPLPAAPADLHAFAPSAERVLFLDQRMRLRLHDSLRYIAGEARGQLELDDNAFKAFLSRLARQPASPLVFSFYSDVVLALEEDELEQAARLLREMMQLPPHPGPPNISALADPAQDATGRRYARFIDTDPSVPFQIFQPSAEAAAGCRAQIRAAFELMDAGDPELAAEIRALLREIVLAAGTEDPKAMTFDGASAFMLWGAIIINANRRDGALGMVQMLAHESSHNLLFGWSADESLVQNPPEALYPSPLRVDPRPMDGIYHATFVTARMYRAVRRLLDSGVLPVALREKARQELAQNAALFAKGMATVERHGELTPLGEAVIHGARDYMAAAG